MPKLKTHGGTKSRIRVTKGGKLMRRHGGGNHNLQKKSASRKRTFAGMEGIQSKVRKSIKINLGV